MSSRRNAQAPTTASSTRRGAASASPASVPASAVTPAVVPRLLEPYDKCKYNDLRNELRVRRIKVPQRGPKRVTTKAAFTATLRAWDRVFGASSCSKEAATAASANSQGGMNNWVVRGAASAAGAQTTACGGGRVVRPRRGCRFRLINVLLSPAFNCRWQEMVALDESKTHMQVNTFWLDVHAAYMTKNPFLDALHFQDALFENVAPNVILSHSAARLLQIWTEVVSMYRTAVNSAKQAAAAATAETPHSFFDYCAGRLDLLYLHMGMLLEPALYAFLMGDAIPSAEPFGHPRPKSSALTKDATVSAVKPLPAKAATPATKKPKKLSAVPVQNPEMSEAQVAAQTALHAQAMAQNTKESAKKETPAKSPAKSVSKTPTKSVAKTPTKTPANSTPSSQKKLAAHTRKPAARKEPRQTPAKANKVAEPDSTTNEMEAKRAVLVPAVPAQAVAAKMTPSATSTDATRHGSTTTSTGNDDTGSQAAASKRPREEATNTAIVEVPSTQSELPSVGGELVPHPAKRVHTGVSTALTTRPSAMMLPPDEWDILENRLRKVNEDIDRCHRGLAGVEVSVSEAYKQSLEADLRFYSAIKQRLQEQLLVVMQSGY